MKLNRYAGNPILQPAAANLWESLITTNPGAWYDRERDRFLLLYRAAGHDPNHRIYFGLAQSKDGFTFERCSEKPVFGPSDDGWDAGCVEDARMVKMGDFYYVTYAARPFPPRQYWLPAVQQKPKVQPLDDTPHAPRITRLNLSSTGLAITRDFKTWIRCGRITDPTIDDRDTILFPEKIGGRYWLLHRPQSHEGEPVFGATRPTIFLACGTNLLKWEENQILIEPREDWEAQKIGGNCPPLRTEGGWLLLYHGVDQQFTYRIGALLLDLEDPRRVLHRTRRPIFEPEAPYERQGVVNNVVFPCGNVIKDGTLHVYYGAADKVCCVATCELDALIEAIRSGN